MNNVTLRAAIVSKSQPMRVAFESTVFDPVGSIGLDALPGSDLSASTRRVTRTATLDGNAVIIDNGYTASGPWCRISTTLY